MATYPNLPDNRLIVNGVDLSTTYNLVLLDGYTLSPPEPKTYTVDIPGGNGVIDLTESLTGDVSFNNRSQEFTFNIIYPENFETIKTKVSNFLHGKAYDYKMTMDPDYTYHGRFTVESYEHSAFTNGLLGQIKIKIEANPYKTKDSLVYKLNAAGGKLYKFESGRRKVHPIVESTETFFITLLPDGDEQVVSPGTHRLNNILFTEGFNECWINTKRYQNITWGDVSETGKFKSLWSELSKYRWDEAQLLDQMSEDIIRAWSDLETMCWNDFIDTNAQTIDKTIRRVGNAAYYKLPVLYRDADESSCLDVDGSLSIIGLDDEAESHHLDGYTWVTWKLIDFVDFSGVKYEELTSVGINMSLQPPVLSMQNSIGFLVISEYLRESFSDFNPDLGDEIIQTDRATTARKLTVKVTDTWENLQKKYISIGVKVPYSSASLDEFIFSDITFTLLGSVYPYKRWYDFNWKKNVLSNGSDVYLTYDWEDL